MPWCPKCKCEYVEGITECKKCGSNLVRELIDSEQILVVGNKDELLIIRDTLQEKGFLSVEVVFDPAEEVYVLISEKKDHDEAQKILLGIMEAKKKELRKSITENNTQPVLPYQKASEKAEEMKNSAFSFLIVGIPGLIIVLLCFFEIIPLHFSFTGKIIILGTMGILFILLILIGFSSMKSFHKLEDSAQKEDKLSEEIKKWYQTELSTSDIESMISKKILDSTQEEEKYFVRIEIIKKLLSEKFMNLEPAYLDEMVENIYQEKFENEN